MDKKLPKTAQTIDKHFWSETAHKVPCKMVLTAFLKNTCYNVIYKLCVCLNWLMFYFLT